MSDAALGATGRVVRCARCGHKWHASPPDVEYDEEFGDDFSSTPEGPEDAFAEPESAEPAGFVIPGFEKDDEESEHGEPAEEENEFPSFSIPPAPEANDDPPLESGESEPVWEQSTTEPEPEPVPEEAPIEPKARTPKAPAPPPKKSKGIVSALVALLLLLLLVGATTSLYVFRTPLIERIPALTSFYAMLGLNNTVVGFGLVFRDVDSERIVQDDIEVMIVRGIIANTTGQPREVPTLRLALMNVNGVVVQEKEIQPPQFLLNAKTSVPFRMTLDYPDGAASRFEITFSSRSVIRH